MSDHSSQFPESLEHGLSDATSLISPPSFSAKTGDITVTVRPIWIEELSDPTEQLYTWVYYVIIENGGKETVQLTGRTWTVLDSTGKKSSSYSQGIAGEQPIIPPKEHFEYTSGAELKTPTGFMVGHYHATLVGEDHYFYVSIPMFSLDSPHQSGLIH
ncbi:Co2+/Mg2+ efflux protein ApaG [Aristophania vespae]|uniref:Co2+/Mg2+ efflux protein ApaG n=1 Tax=Aristophania vespae TaxID=2697033 RepID=A0A6P1NCK0_9PROT|nr:Co2+/Mg2+ efflux protein ApaG [Aristophania vespae]QHI95233.1 Co2+/Mg2+ efflux protein ApaG [Aristophania vespae]UMM64476.1 Protein ApaG [Aristophania vespae]